MFLDLVVENKILHTHFASRRDVLVFKNSHLGLAEEKCRIENVTQDMFCCHVFYWAEYSKSIYLFIDSNAILNFCPVDFCVKWTFFFSS